MNKIVLDYSAIKALLEEDDPNHILVENMIKSIDNMYTYYVPYHIFSKVMNLCKKDNNDTKYDIYYILNNATRLQHLKGNIIYEKSLKTYQKYDNISYEDCLTIEYMKEKDIKHILSFNTNLDNVKEIKRVYDFSQNNKKRLNF